MLVGDPLILLGEVKCIDDGNRAVGVHLVDLIPQYWWANVQYDRTEERNLTVEFCLSVVR